MDTNVSKTLSYWLRHEPGDAGLNPDPQGFVDAESLLDALGSKYSGKNFDWGWLEESIPPSGTKRFERHGDQIRAKYGHSIEIELDLPEIQEPGDLYHGTSPGAWESIRQEGLRPQGRQYVHLTTDRKEARRVGQRHAADPVIVRVQVPSGTDRRFFQAGDMVLTDHVPPDWLEPID